MMNLLVALQGVNFYFHFLQILDVELSLIGIGIQSVTS